MMWLSAAGLSLTLFAAVVSGTFVALSDGGRTEYVFAWAGGRLLLLLSAAIAVTLIAAHRVVVAAARRYAPHRADDTASGRWLAPAVALGAVSFCLMAAAPGFGARASALVYFLFDLRWWWAAAVFACLLWRADAVLDHPAASRVRAALERASPSRLLLFLDAGVFAVVIAWAVVTTPHLRFTGILHGDEPKYLRYCESLDQGHGIEISHNAQFDELGLTARPHYGRDMTLLVDAVRDDARALVRDLRAWTRDPIGFRWNRAQPSEGWFLIGKNGDLYQVHQPGLSFLLQPGYYLDRHLIGTTAGYQGEFPQQLVMTNMTLLAWFGFCGVAIFRLVRRAVGHDGLAAGWACFAMMTLPTTAFAFQIYPEMPAATIVVVVVNALLFHARPGASRWISMGAGAAAAFLLWLHPRFLLVSAVFLAAAFVLHEGRGRRRFVAAYVAVLASFGGFAYHVTGSWLPTAMYGPEVSSAVFSAAAVPFNLLGYAFDRAWGVVPHAPVLLLALPALVVLVRVERRAALLLAAVVLALAVPAAGHGMSRAAATPGRHLVAVLPLFVWPIAVFGRRFWPSAAFRVLLIVLLVLSLDAAWAYNWSHLKEYGPMLDPTGSGWKPNLLFPNMAGGFDSMSLSHRVLFLSVVAGVAAVGAWARFARALPRPPRRLTWRVACALAGCIVGGATAVSIAAGQTVEPDYQPDARASRRAALAAMVPFARCRVCFSSGRGWVGWQDFGPSGADSFTITPRPASGRDVVIDIDLRGGDAASIAFGRVHIEFGDGRDGVWVGVMEHAAVARRFERAGTYYVFATLAEPRGVTRVARATIDVTDQ